ncbi:MAG: A/G-specific adenine glycosylase [Bdellovibrionales bacterium]|nr:A/G-specific adenine glycosylase [Bdellovibrionales bacterium]
MKKNERVVNDLFSWFSKNGRDLPWRQTRDPYCIWISEIILQQTQVVRGISYYQRFLERFPTLSDLAQARWSSVLSVWRGLGYYARAKNLRKSAKEILSQYGGTLPTKYDELIELPGVGPYTASAILSFAHGKSVPAIDTNVQRIVQRVYGCPVSQVEKRAEALFRIRPRSGRKLNYALMDLGAMICSARTPKCIQCPLLKSCVYRKTDPIVPQKASKPARKLSKSPVVIQVAIACIHENGEYLIGNRKKEVGGKWEFPGGKVEAGEGIRAAVKREVQEELGVEVSVRPPFLVSEHQDKEFLWRLNFC